MAFLQGLIGGLTDYMQQPNQGQLQSPNPSEQEMQRQLMAQQQMSPQMQQLQQSQMQGQMRAAQAGLPQSGFSGEMSMGQNPMMQSQANPLEQPGLLELVGRSLAEQYMSGRGQKPSGVSPFTPEITKPGTGIMGVGPAVGMKSNTGQWMRSLAASAAGGAAMSDKRLKKNITKIGALPSGIGVYSWTWNDSGNTMGLHGDSIGVIAQEVAEIMPDAVISTPSGYLAVNYSAL